MGLGDFLNIGSVNLKNYISEKLEIGFSQNGPTLAIAGTLTASGSTIFINNISLLLSHKQDNTQCQFIWFAFRPHRFALSGYKGIELKAPLKFMVTPNAPHPYNILFYDQIRYAEMIPTLKKIRKGWEDLVRKNERVFTDTDYRILFERFILTEETSNCQNELEQLCYWKAGEYLLKTIIVPQNSKQLIEVQKKIFISSDDSLNLKKNASAVIADICRQATIPYVFVHPPLS